MNLLLADVPVPLQVFRQGFRGPLVAGGVPVAVMWPARVARLGALAADVIARSMTGMPDSPVEPDNTPQVR